MPCQNEAHQILVNALLLQIGSLPNVRLWKRVVGVGKTFSGQTIKFGIPGEPDLQGIIAPHGRMLLIECKTGNAKLSKYQIRFRDMALKFGAAFIEARSVEQTLTDLQKYL